jgi:hypothetical protein
MRDKRKQLISQKTTPKNLYKLYYEAKEILSHSRSPKMAEIIKSEKNCFFGKFSAKKEFFK